MSKKQPTTPKTHATPCSSCAHDICPECADCASDPYTAALLEEVNKAVLPLLPDNAHDAEIAAEVAPGGHVDLEGYAVVNDETVELDLAPVRETLVPLFQACPEKLLAAGYGPTNVYVVYLDKGREPVLLPSHDIAFGGRMSVQEICAGFEAELAEVLPDEGWETACLELVLDRDEETDIAASFRADGEEYDLTDDLLECASDRLTALFNELRVCAEVPKDGWNMAEFTLTPDGVGDLQLYQVEDATDETDRKGAHDDDNG